MNENDLSYIRFGVSYFLFVCKSNHLIKSGKIAQLARIS